MQPRAWLYLCKVVVVDSGASCGEVFREHVGGADEEVVANNLRNLPLVEVAVPQVFPVSVLQQTTQGH